MIRIGLVKSQEKHFGYLLQIITRWVKEHSSLPLALTAFNSEEELWNFEGGLDQFLAVVVTIPYGMDLVAMLNNIKLRRNEYVGRVAIISETARGNVVGIEFQHTHTSERGDSALANDLFRYFDQILAETYLQSFTFRDYGETIKMPYKDICYFHCVDHMVRIVTSHKRKYRCYVSLKEISQQLPVCFFRPNRSFIVNQNYVVKLKENTLVMLDNKVISVSTRKRSVVDKLLFGYRDKGI